MKRIILWALGLVIVVVSGLAFELVRETRQHTASHLMACMERETALMSWVCKQVFFHDDFSAEAIATLNTTAGIRAVTVLSNPAEADEAFRRLRDEGVDIDATDVTLHHMTALHAAAIDGDVHQVRRLLANDARRDIRDDSGRTAIDYALEMQAKNPGQPQWGEIFDLLSKP